MSALFEVLLWFIAVLVAVPLMILALECVAAVARPHSPPPSQVPGPRPRCAVLIPAHDEEGMLPRTLADLQPQMELGDRVVVVADNCSDNTAVVARQGGAEAIMRTDPDRRGKGFALSFGVDFLRADPPDVVVVIDADCRVPHGTIDQLVRTSAARSCPIQSAYTLDPPMDATPTARLSALAFRFKNLVRPLGLHNLRLPCLLTGTGMAFP